MLPKRLARFGCLLGVFATFLISLLFIAGLSAQQAKAADCGLPAGTKPSQVAASVASRAGFSGNDLVVAVAIAEAESSFVPTETNLAGRVVGLWQVYYDQHLDLVVEGKPIDIARLAEPYYNAQAAHMIFVKSGWGPWDTWWQDAGRRTGPGEGAYKAHILEAQEAVTSLGGTAATGCGGHLDVVPGVAMTCPSLSASRGYGSGGSGIYAGFHKGLDLLCPAGTPVLAVSDGVVHHLFSGCNDFASSCGYGTYATLEPAVAAGSEAVQYLYGHLGERDSSASPAARAYATPDGAAVKAGDIIGYEGTTGFSSGYHVHFQVNVSGSAVNPCSGTFLEASYPNPRWHAAGCPYTYSP